MKIKKTKLIQSVIFVALAITLLLVSINLINQTEHAKDNGYIIVSFKNEDHMITKKVEYTIGDNLMDLITHNFNNVSIIESSYGPFLFGIEDYVTPSNYETYLGLYVDDVYSLVGINQIELKNEITILIKVEKAWK